jgi:hypothetical protein
MGGGWYFEYLLIYFEKEEKRKKSINGILLWTYMVNVMKDK